MRTLTAIAALLALAMPAGPAAAEEHEVRMLNKGSAGIMVFEPAFVRAAPGDTVRFVPTDRGHNAETIKGMVPAGAAGFRGEMNEEVVLQIEAAGVYGVKCAPHYGLGMVALIVAGEPDNAAEAMAVKHPGKAKIVFADLFGQTAFASR
jgi:pseudoazurin